jgi:hypothetical protein
VIVISRHNVRSCKGQALGYCIGIQPLKALPEATRAFYEAARVQKAGHHAVPLSLPFLVGLIGYLDKLLRTHCSPVTIRIVLKVLRVSNAYAGV